MLVYRLSGFSHKVLINVKNEYSKKEAGKGREEAGSSVVFKD